MNITTQVHLPVWGTNATLSGILAIAVIVHITPDIVIVQITLDILIVIVIVHLTPDIQKCLGMWIRSVM